MKRSRRAVAGFAANGFPRQQGVALAYRGVQRMVAGEYAEAEKVLTSAVDLLRSLEASRDEAQALRWLALLYRRSGRFEGGPVALPGCDSALGSGRGHRSGKPSPGRSLRSSITIWVASMKQSGGLRMPRVWPVALAIGPRVRWRLATRGWLRCPWDSPISRESACCPRWPCERDLRDVAGEGRITGLLGILHHVTDQPGAARAFYGDALALLERVADHRLEAMFGGWYAALVAEGGDLAQATALFQRARENHGLTSDPQVGEALNQLAGALTWLEASMAKETGDLSQAQALESEVLGRLTEAFERDPPLPGEARLAAARVERMTQR